MNKRFHTDTRVSENFSVKGLQSLTGQEVSSFLQYMVKEIIGVFIDLGKNPTLRIQLIGSPLFPPTFDSPEKA